jgi:hypothetical protein
MKLDFLNERLLNMREGRESLFSLKPNSFWICVLQSVKLFLLFISNYYQERQQNGH